jgi:hypothetical protein
MSYFKISRRTYTTRLLKAGRYGESEPIYTRYDVYDALTGTIFLSFQQPHKKYLTDWQIQCTPEWEKYKELLPEIILEINNDNSEGNLYDYSLLLKAVREIKLNELLD